jgi:putative transposase
MRLRLTENAHHPRECCIGPCAHVEMLDCERGHVDPDHAISSRSHAANASGALVGHSIVIRELPLRIRTRIARPVNDGYSSVDGADLNRAGSVSATGKNPGEGPSRRVGRTGSTLFGSATRDCLIHRRSMFAFTCSSRATAATDAPGLLPDAMAAALNAGVYRRRRRFSAVCISVHLKISGHYRHANANRTVDDFAGRLQPVGDVCRQMGVSEATFYVWKKRYGNLGLLEVRELRQLRDENARLKRLVADLTLDRHILQEVVKKKI